jgi:hypothetical protein
MWQQMIAFLKSFFLFPDVKFEWVLVAAVLAILFGVIWIYAHWPPLFKKHWLWAVAVFSAFFILLAIVFVQIPLQTWTNTALLHFFNQKAVLKWLLLIGIPYILLSGLVQEGAKMVPAVVFWWRNGRKISPRMALAIGAIAGAAFGIFEAFWVFGQMFAAGWTFSAIRADGFEGVSGLLVRFFTIGFHTAAGALSGYGLSKGKGWQFYLIAAGSHALLNYVTLFVQKNYFNLAELVLWIGVITMAISVWVLLLRWGKWSDPELTGELAPVSLEPTGSVSADENKPKEENLV